MSGAGEDDYPHNWLLQVWLDGGVVAAVLCLATLAIAPAVIVRLGRRARLVRRVVWLPLLGAYIFLLLEFAKSSDFYAERGLFALAVLAVYASRSPADAGRNSASIAGHGAAVISGDGPDARGPVP
jgi:O-antigen ligase